MAKNKDQVHFKGGLGIVTVPSSASKMATPNSDLSLCFPYIVQGYLSLLQRHFMHCLPLIHNTQLAGKLPNHNIITLW